MKKTHLISFVVVVAAIAALYGAAASHAQSPAPAAAFESTKDFGKLDAGLQKAWADAKASGNMDTRVDCFIRINEMPDSGDRTFLESHGFVVNTFAGDIARGHTNVGSLPSIASLYFVSTIKTAK